MPTALHESRPLFFLLTGYVLAQGVFASGVLALLEHLPGVSPAWVFSAYFFGLVLGQGLIVCLPRLRGWRWGYAFGEALFGLSLVLMAAAVSRWQASLIVGRALEGLGAGLSLPLGFAILQRLRALRSVEAQLAWVNSAFALGFVLGPAVYGALSPRLSVGELLLGSGLVFLGATLFIGPASALLLRGSPEGGEGVVDVSGSRPSSVRVALMLAKGTYGFSLPVVAQELSPRSGLSVAAVVLMMAVAFVVGQAAGEQLGRRVSARSLARAIPAALGVALGMLAWTGALAALLLVAALQSLLLHWATARLAQRPDGARSFALQNVLSDWAMPVGAGLAVLGVSGAAVLSAAALVFVARPAWRDAPQGGASLHR